MLTQLPGDAPARCTCQRGCRCCRTAGPTGTAPAPRRRAALLRAPRLRTPRRWLEGPTLRSAWPRCLRRGAGRHQIVTASPSQRPTLPPACPELAAGAAGSALRWTLVLAVTPGRISHCHCGDGHWCPGRKSQWAGGHRGCQGRDHLHLPRSWALPAYPQPVPTAMFIPVIN